MKYLTTCCSRHVLMGLSFNVVTERFVVDGIPSLIDGLSFVLDHETEEISDFLRSMDSLVESCLSTKYRQSIFFKGLDIHDREWLCSEKDRMKVSFEILAFRIGSSLFSPAEMRMLAAASRLYNSISNRNIKEPGGSNTPNVFFMDLNSGRSLLVSLRD